jgi:cytochrome bd ubiquinol oxidase subunit I
MDTSTILSRLQFAFTIAYHYLFPQFTMGLALLLVILKTLYLWRKDERFNVSTHFWGKIFAVTFVLGVVTGIPMEFQFGTNWARFSAYAGDIIAQTLAMEGAFAFFLESAFLGIFLFGERLGQKLHWFSTVMVWLGTWASGGFIIASNAWMQHPVGFTVVGDKLHISNYWAVLTNSWAIIQYIHTMSAAVVTASFVMTGVGAYYLLAKKHLDYARIFVTIGIVMGLLSSFFQLYPSGDLNGGQVAANQPAKLAAMEGLFYSKQGAELVIIGQPDLATGQLDNAIVVPYVLSFLSYHRWTAEVKGIYNFPADQRPDSIELLYYSYHIMVGLGTFFIAIMALAALLLFWGKRLYTARWMQWILLLAMPFPFIATTAGWFTTELGRQPWIVYGMLRTVDGSSSTLSIGNVLFTLIGFMGMYLLFGLLYILLVVNVMLRGPVAEAANKEEEAESKDEPGLLGNLASEQEGEN